MLFQERTRSRPFGALVAQYLVLLRGKLRAPFGVSLFNLEFLGSLRWFGTQPAERGEAEQAGDGSEQDTAVKHHGLRARPAERLAVKYGPHEEKLHGTGLDILTFLRASDSFFKRSGHRFA
jgi:hypothetical protein